MTVNSSWTEPVVVDADNPPKYPFNNITQTASGHSFEMDDTPGKERVRVQHRSGSFIEMQPDGTEVHKIYGDGYEIIAGAKNVMIKGQCNITIQGASVVTVKGDSFSNVEGNVTQQIKGNLVQQVDGTAKITSKGDMDLTSKEDITMSAQNVYVNGDLAVRGAISSTLSISATNNITAYYSSDKKFKENIRPIPDALNKVEAIGGKLFDWTDEYIQNHGGEDGYFVQKADFGVIAQDVQSVFPIATRTRPDGSLAVDYEKLAALAFAAIAELQSEVAELKNRLGPQ